jgi:hypothetical protein
MIPPQPPHPHILPRSATPAASSLQEKCTFTLWHKQLSGSSPTKNYVYLPKLIDHTNNLVIDITAAKPAQEHNSYTRVSETQKYSIAGLLDDDALTISAHDGSDVLVFETQRLRWEAGAEKVVTEGAEAWCQVQEWVESGLANRVSLHSHSNCDDDDNDDYDDDIRKCAC